MEVLLLVGGLGTRLRSVVKDVPKSMADISGEPFLKYVLDWITDYNPEKIHLSVGYKREIIIDYFGREYKGIPIDYHIETEPLGTGGAVLNVLKNIDITEPFLIMNGDTICHLDINEMFACHSESGLVLTLAVKRMKDTGRYGRVSVEDGKVILFEEKKGYENGLINCGIYIVDKGFLKYIDINENKFSLEREVFEPMAKDCVINAYQTEEYFLDIGLPQDLNRAKDILKLQE